MLQLFADGMAIIHDILPRKTKFSRKVAGKKFDEQVMATNIDVIFIVQGLDNNFNPRRLERTLVMVNESGVKPVIILNKSDLCESTQDKVEQTKEILKDIPIIAVSAKENKGINELKSFLKEGETFAFIGSSGVGKSTLINKLVGQDILKTQEVRSGDSKGRHTTARRELIVLADGGCLIDTPGMRELQLWHADEGLSDTFSDIDDLAENCHFSDCSHTKEIKCAVLSAIESGDLVQGRYDSYIKLQKELKFLASKNSKEGYVEHRKKDKRFGKMYKQIMKEKKNKKR